MQSNFWSTNDPEGHGFIKESPRQKSLKRGGQAAALQANIEAAREARLFIALSNITIFQ